MDKITLNDLYNMGDVLYGELEKLKSAIPEVPAVWDAVIRLTHADDTGGDVPASITPSIVSGTFAQLYGKILNSECPCILVEYEHPMFGVVFAVPMAYIVGGSENVLQIDIAGYSTAEGTFKRYGALSWTSSDTISWGS